MKVAVVILTWQRWQKIKKNLFQLYRQSTTDFDIIISNGNLRDKVVDYLDKVVRLYADAPVKTIIRHDGNDDYTFRRFYVGRDLAEQGYDVVLFIDDDVTVPPFYVENCLKQYEPKSYKSGYAWVLHHKGKSYYKHRTRRFDNEQQVHYCGTGFCMIDASIFLDPGLISKAPKESYKIEDLWLSYYAQHVKKWKLAYMSTPKVHLEGADNVALYKQVAAESFTKDDLLKKLVKMGWKLPD